MAQEVKKFLDQKGVELLWSKLSLEDYPNNDTLIAVINAIDKNKANQNDLNTLANQVDILSSLVEDTAPVIISGTVTEMDGLNAVAQLNPIPDWADITNKINNGAQVILAIDFGGALYYAPLTECVAVANTGYVLVFEDIFVSTQMTDNDTARAMAVIQSYDSYAYITLYSVVAEVEDKIENLKIRVGFVEDDISTINGDLAGVHKHIYDIVDMANDIAPVIINIPMEELFDDGNNEWSFPIPAGLDLEELWTKASNGALIRLVFRTNQNSVGLAATLTELAWMEAQGKRFIFTSNSIVSNLFGERDPKNYIIVIDQWTDSGDNTPRGHIVIDYKTVYALEGKVDKVDGKGLSTNDYTTAEKSKLSGIAANAEVNQNAFSNIKIGSTTIAADSKTDTLTLVAGSNVTLTPDATNDAITIAATDTTYGNATTSAAGLMSASDKSKLDGIATGANKITVDSSMSSTSTNPVQNKVVNTALSGKVPTTRKVNGKALSADITLSAADVGADASGSANTALTNAQSYTDTAIANLINGAPTTLDTLGEIAAAMSEYPEVVDALEQAIGNKVDKVSGKGLSTNDYTTTEKNKLSGIAANAEVNQNAFSNVTVGSTTIAADSKTDTLTLVAGSNVTLTPDATNDKITIAATDTVYTHPTYTSKSSGLYKITVDGTGHVSGATAVVKADITGLGIPAQDTTYKAATTAAAGLMSATDKAKLDGIAENANNYTYTLPNATSSVLGGVKVGSNITVSSGTISLTKANVTAALGYTPPTTDTTYVAATTSVAGLMSAADKAKLDGIADNANNYTYSLPTASSSTLGGVKIGTGIAIASGVISNSGVRSISTGSTNGTISVNTNGTSAEVAVKGLGSLAYSSDTYAGGTAVTLNGSSKAKSTASFYAPTSAGTSGQFLKSNGSGAPTWGTVAVSGLAHVGTSQPSNADYVLWVDTDEEQSAAMRADAIKYKSFSIATSAWSGSGPYTYTMSATGITANTAILNLTLDATSQTYQKAQLDWETKANQIVLSTATKPTGTLSGYLIATEVTMI